MGTKKPERKKKFTSKNSGNKSTDRRFAGKKRVRNNPLSQKKPDDDSIRLNKFIASAGICSRREADEYIKAGLVSVNGRVVSELGSKIQPADDVRYNGERIKTQKLVYVLLNKPKDFVTTTKDPHAKRTVQDLVANACSERIYPVGRLDRNTTGVLLFTNDGELTTKLTHPAYNKMKIYHVTLNKNVSGVHLKEIQEGITLEDGFIKADAISYTDPNEKRQVGIELHSGRNRIVRRIFEHFGYNVRKLDRVYFAGLTKKGLLRGKWRFLTEHEVGILKMGSYK